MRLEEASQRVGLLRKFFSEGCLLRYIHKGEKMRAWLVKDGLIFTCELGATS